MNMHCAMNPVSDPVVIREVGLRDGLQSIATVLPTERKKQWLRDAGRRRGRSKWARSPGAPAAGSSPTRHLAPSPGPCRSCVSSLCRTSGRRRASRRADVMLSAASAHPAHSLANLRPSPYDVVRKCRILAARDAARSNCLLGRHQHGFGCPTRDGRTAEGCVWSRPRWNAGVDRGASPTPSATRLDGATLFDHAQRSRRPCRAGTSRYAAHALPCLCGVRRTYASGASTPSSAHRQMPARARPTRQRRDQASRTSSPDGVPTARISTGSAPCRHKAGRRADREDARHAVARRTARTLQPTWPRPVGPAADACADNSGTLRSRCRTRACRFKHW